jgi:hypothetical protein
MYGCACVSRDVYGCACKCAYVQACHSGMLRCINVSRYDDINFYQGTSFGIRGTNIKNEQLESPAVYMQDHYRLTVLWYELL